MTRYKPILRKLAYIVNLPTLTPNFNTFKKMKSLLPIITIICLIFAFNVYHAYRITPKGNRHRNGEKIKRKKPINDLLFELPKQIGKDIARKDLNRFPKQGLIVFEGRQGSGKTISMVKYATDLKKQYNDLYIAGNLKYKYSEKLLKNSLDMYKISKGSTGALILLDECQVWYNSKNSKNLDESATQYFTTCRKNVRLILATAQNFYMLSKDLRSQTRLLITCYTFGALTIQVKKEPILDSMGELKKMKFKGIDYFVHTDEIRESYDTSEMIGILTKNGLKERVNRLDQSGQKE